VVNRPQRHHATDADGLRPDAAPTSSAWSYATKRVLDIGLAAILIVLLSPLLAIVGLAIRLDSRGPALFIQRRAGAKPHRHGHAIAWERTEFDVYKFRSMYVDGDETPHREYIARWTSGEAEENDEGPKFKLNDDDRVTRVGAIIRRTSVDELPQLFNVVKGDMSLVGPRPVPTYELANYEAWHYERFHALPGITGYWQVYGRGSVPFDEMMRMDIRYVREQSLWMDLKLLALTLPAVLSTRGAR
jgi:lipopolysaccharide/colanic/teichoic acid biosynthesis glycosyltransferase